MNNKQTQLTSTELKSTELNSTELNSTELNSTELSSAGVFFPSGVMSLILEYCDARSSVVKKQAIWREYQARNEGEEMSSCPFCERTYSDGDIVNGSVVPCTRCYKCFVGDCGHYACECVFTDDDY